MKSLKLDNINMIFFNKKSENLVLKDINFQAKNEDFIAIVGPSGCGKSTILNIIAGLITPTFGSANLDNEEIKDCNNKIAYMFQSDHLFPWLSVWNNVTLGLKIQKKYNKSNIEFIENLLKKYDLIDYKSYYPNEISGGMKQKVALIRTLALNPELLLLDEPFSALDYQTRLKIGDEVYKIIKEEKKTAIIVTHDIPEAISLSNKVLILSKNPACIKAAIDIEFPEEFQSPLQRRKSPMFGLYYEKIWEELEDEKSTCKKS
ncbi:ABC transporter ATP-binding protein [Oceanirhabdus seepicola]|uniref:ABC transporter ATP-binding protein n=1 Tax=Oceanirhabdus seepicola TaxID=2828781 RepID=A0A9J6NXM9_9CLOT|nr:ABC transporter ATP-binding protein [Oceanirhabdus seepicola]MCM1989210.1 ABC transporter ATP-binding protein [Oceanirhabdus seepicola]